MTPLKLWRRVLITITAVGAVVASFIFLTGLAVHAGWPSWAAPLLPLCVDALAAMALTEYRRTGNRTAAVVAVLAIIMSALGNAASHWLTAGLLEPGWLVITLVGVVPAVSLGVCVHLTVPKGMLWNQLRNSDRTSEPSSVPERDQASKQGDGSGSSSDASSSDTGFSTHHHSSTQTGSASAASVSAGSDKRRKRTDEQLLEVMRMNGWSQTSATKLTGLLGVSKSRALRLKRMMEESSKQS